MATKKPTDPPADVAVEADSLEILVHKLTERVDTLVARVDDALAAHLQHIHALGEAVAQINRDLDADTSERMPGHVTARMDRLYRCAVERWAELEPDEELAPAQPLALEAD